MNNKIHYKTSAIYNTSSDEDTTIDLNSTCINYLRIYTIINNFMKYNPPCRECLIQGMCISEKLSHSLQDHLHIKVCNKLKKFINNNDFFYNKNEN